jgi:hypothetical protein
MRAVIEGHRDVWPIDVHLGKGDLLSNTCVGRSSGRCSGFVLRADNRRENNKEGYYETKRIYHITCLRRYRWFVGSNHFTHGTTGSTIACQNS